MTRIVLAGDQALDTAVGTSFNSVSLPVINDRGDIVFFGRLQLATSEVGTQGTVGIWLYLNQSGQIQLVSRVGDSLLPGMERVATSQTSPAARLRSIPMVKFYISTSRPST